MLKIHIDTDIGGDIDDLCALAMALKWEGTDLVGVTTVAEHVGTNQLGGKRAGMVRYVLGLVLPGRYPCGSRSRSDAGLLPHLAGTAGRGGLLAGADCAECRGGSGRYLGTNEPAC